MSFTPYSHFDGEVALFPAWQDGMPKRGPSPTRDHVEPYFSCHASIGISRAYADRAAAFGSLSQGGKKAGAFSISVSAKEGSESDELGYKKRFPHREGKYCLVIIYRDDDAGVWNRFQFFHVEISADDFSEGEDTSTRSMTFAALHLDEDRGLVVDGVPSLSPVVFGYVEWIHGGQSIPCIRYDRDTGKWSQRGASDTGLANQPYALWDGPDVPLTNPSMQTFSLFQPRAEAYPYGIKVAGTLNSEYNGFYLFAGVSSMGPVWAQVGSTVVVTPAGDITGGGRAFVKYDTTDWRLQASSSWDVEEPNDYIFQTDGVNRQSPDLVATWEHAAESDITGTVITYELVTPGGMQIVWQQRLVFSLAVLAGQRNKLILHEGQQLETNGSAEPVESISQSAYLDESYCIFHCMGKVFMTVGHDRICVPRLSAAPWPVHHGFVFSLGDTMLDQYGWWNVIA